MEPVVTVIIGAGGLGLACAAQTSSKHSIVLADNSAETLRKGVIALQEAGLNVISQEVDITDADSVRDLVAFATAAGQVMAVIHTAGLAPTTAAAKEIYNVNLLGTSIIINTFAPAMSRRSSMVCIASLAGHFVSFSPSLESHIAASSADRILHHNELKMDATSSEAYTISKRANLIQVQAATSKWGKQGIRFNTISPGVISTAAGNRELETAPGAKAMVDISAAQRAGLPEEVANVASFLVGSSSSFVTGSDILVDGGAFASRRWAGL
ncbi:unnamed protein product [Penicillium olsonii]|nr:unnamed protein product [Penicillium olsonii]